MAAEWSRPCGHRLCSERSGVACRWIRERPNGSPGQRRRAGRSADTSRNRARATASRGADRTPAGLPKGGRADARRRDHRGTVSSTPPGGARCSRARENDRKHTNAASPNPAYGLAGPKVCVMAGLNVPGIGVKSTSPGASFLRLAKR